MIVDRSLCRCNEGKLCCAREMTLLLSTRACSCTPLIFGRTSNSITSCFGKGSSRENVKNELNIITVLVCGVVLGLTFGKETRVYCLLFRLECLSRDHTPNFFVMLTIVLRTACSMCVLTYTPCSCVSENGCA